MMKKHECRRSAFTVVELAISTVLVVTVTGAAAMVANTVLSSATEGMMALDIERSGQRLLGRLEEDLTVAKLTRYRLPGPQNGVDLQFLVPVDVGEDTNGNRVLDTGEDENGNAALDLTDGDIQDPDGKIQWGVTESDGDRLDTPAVPARALIRPFITANTVTEAQINTDLNKDGDLEDTFNLGSIRYETSGGEAVDFGRESVIFDPQNQMADLDGDQLPDPWLSIEGEPFTDQNGNRIWDDGEPFVDHNNNNSWNGRLRVKLYILRTTDDDKYVLRHYTVAWRIQNIDDE